MQGEIINGFVLKKLLGEGGMAEVWYAENEIGKPAAVKILFEKLTRNEKIVERFHNEALVMVKLRHPNIRQVYSYGYLGNRHCIVMEYLDGDDLSALMKGGRRFTEEELERWWNQIVDALNYTHQQGIVHRDIKPSNVFLDEYGNIKLLDFGIAKIMENNSLTQTGSMMGTLMYMSPEQVKDSKSIDYHTDIYSLAVTFVNLLTGKNPYDSDTTSDFEIREKIVYTPFDVSVLPEEWQGFLAPYLEKEPQNRPELRHFEPTPLAKPAAAASPSNTEDAKTTISQPPVMDNPPSEAKTSTDAPQTVAVQQDSPKRKSKAGLFIGLGIGVAAIVAAVVLLFLLMPSPDTEAFQECSSVNDYRSYMQTYGSKGHHYDEAKAIVDKYMADSTEKALEQERARQRAEAERAKAEAEQKENESYNKCTTIAACDSYLKTYPEGRYVSQVKAKKEELEQKAAQEAAAKKAVAKQQIQNATNKKQETQPKTPNKVDTKKTKTITKKRK